MRIRRVLAWAGLWGYSPAVAVGVLAAVTHWCVMMWQGPGGIPNSTRVWLGAGSLVVAWGEMPMRPRTTISYLQREGWRAFPRRLREPLMFKLRLEIYRGQVRVPLWGVVALLALPPGGAHLLAWRRRVKERRPADACASCGYDMHGLHAGAVCPECGERTHRVRGD